MLRVRNPSGDPVATLTAEELQGIADGAQPVKALKRFLQGLCSQTRFRQRLLSEDGRLIQDDEPLAAPAELQLVVMPFAEASFDDTRELLDAARAGDDVEVERLLHVPLDPNIQMVDNDTALHCAAQEGHLAVAELLFEASADPNILWETAPLSALAVAAATGAAEMARRLLEAKAIVNLGWRDAEGEDPIYDCRPLNEALKSNQPDMVRLLLEARADPNVPYTDSSHGSSPLHIAAEHGRAEVVQMLLDARADANCGMGCHDSPLNALCGSFLSTGSSHCTAAELLLEASADPDCAGLSGDPPLIAAIMNGQQHLVRALVKARADIERPGADGDRPLICAKSYAEVEIYATLLEAGASVDPNARPWP